MTILTFLAGGTAYLMPGIFTYVVNTKLAAQWEERGIVYDREGWKAYLPALVGWGALFVMWYVHGTTLSWESIPFGLLAAMSVVAARTDAACRLIPWEIGIFTGLFGMVVTIPAVLFSSDPTAGWFSVAFAFFGLVVLPIVARAITKGLGAGDIRLLWAFTGCVAWWVGPVYLLYGIILACIGQVAVHANARIKDTGEKVPHRKNPEKFRRFVAFGPMLLAGLWAMVLYSLITGTGTCEVWSVTGAC